MSEIFLYIFVTVDDWYQAHASEYRKSQPGKKPEFSDSEVMSVMLAMDFIPFPSERQFLAYLRANYLDLFPNLLDQSQFNRRARKIAPLLEGFRQYCLLELGITLVCEGLLDTKPVPVIGYRRSKKRSDFVGSADYGYCASRKLYYYGYKLVAISTLSGIPIIYDLVPANTDERKAAETLLDQVRGFHLFADKGFLGNTWQAEIRSCFANIIWTPKRRNQHKQQSKTFERWLNGLRLRIEGLFNEIQNVGKNVERLLAKTVVGLCARIAAKMTSHLLKYFLRYNFGIDVLTFSKINA
jgi:transposase